MVRSSTTSSMACADNCIIKHDPAGNPSGRVVFRKIFVGEPPCTWMQMHAHGCKCIFYNANDANNNININYNNNSIYNISFNAGGGVWISRCEKTQPDRFPVGLCRMMKKSLPFSTGVYRSRALVLTLSLRRSMNSAKLMAPRSSPVRRRTETVWFSTSRSPTTSI